MTEITAPPPGRWSMTLRQLAVVRASSRTTSAWLNSRPVLPGVLVCIGYYFGAKLGFALTLHPQPVSTLWPPNAILMAALLLVPPRNWWFILLAAFPGHWAAQLQGHVPLRMMICWFISNSFEAVLGAALIRYLVGGPLRFDNLRQLGVFIGCGVLFAPFLSSFLDAGFVILNRWGESSYWEVWRTRFFSNALATMTLVTVIVSWKRRGIRSLFKMRRRHLVEAASLMALLLAIGFAVFLRREAGPARQPALLYAPLLFLLWAALRFGFVGTSTSVFVVALVAIWGTAHGQGPFSSRTPLENALSVQTFLLLASIPLLGLAAVLQERRKAEEDLRRSETRYREVVETQTDLICRFLPDTTLTFVNEAYCRFFGRRRDELVGMKFLQFLPKDVRKKSADHIASLASNPRVEPVEHQVLLPDGTLAWHQWTNHPIRGPDGQIKEFQGIGRDITDRKRAEEATEKLTHVGRLAIVGEMTASIVHELTQPLGAILSNAEAAEVLLQARSRNIEDVRQILADIRKDDVRASEIIQHIRNLLRRRQIEMQVLNFNELAQETVGFIATEARRRLIKCETSLASGLPIVKGNRIQLQQVLLNFALNGMDAMADTPQKERRLILRSGLDPTGGVQVTVRDFGCGIPGDRLPKLFESFFTTKKDGMGLGLSISRGIIETHQGRIWGENNRDGGATFGFVLPPIAMNVA